MYNFKNVMKNFGYQNAKFRLKKIPGSIKKSIY